MKKKTIVVVGGVAGGMSFANRYRRLNIDDEIIVFEKGPFVSFANCGLPYHISGEIKSRQSLLVVKEELLQKRFNLNVRSNSEVISINPEQKKIQYRSNQEIFEQSYDELVISTGAKPIVPTIEGLDRIPFFTLRNIPDLDKIMLQIKNHHPKHVSILGAGFIGLELAENLKMRGIEVALIEKSRDVLPVLDPEVSIHAKNALIQNGIDVYTNNEIIKIEPNTLYLKSGQEVKTDFLIISIGVAPDTTLLKNIGANLGMKGGIIVDHNYQTSIPHIYAVGDAIIVKNQISNQDTLIPLASPANCQGRQLADILSGLNVYNKGSIGTSIVKVFDMSFASTGLTEKQLTKGTYHVIHLLANDHASYYPGATSIHLKVIFDKVSHQILGAQAFGQKGVDKRIDIISTAIKAKLTITDLQELEFTYAPPYSSAKDIVNLAGYVGQNIILGISQSVQWYDVEKLKNEGYLFIDVRSFIEREGFGYIEGSMHIDIDELYLRYQEIPKDKKLVVYCQSGTRSYNAERLLRAKGFEVYNLDGSYSVYDQISKEMK